MQTYMTKYHAVQTMESLKGQFPPVNFGVVEANGGFVIQAKRPEHMQWSDEIVSSLNEHGVEIVVDTHAPIPDETPPTTEAQAPAVAATVAGTPEAVPAEKPKKEPKPKVKWSVMWKTAPDKVAARVAKGEPPFKPGSKRDITRQLLQQEGGCTLDEAMAALGWDKPTCLSSFTEIATLLDRRKVITTKGAEGQPNRYTMGPAMTEAQIEEERKIRAARKIELAAEKEEKAKKKAEQKADAAAAAVAAQQASAGQPQTEHAAAP